MQSDNNQALWLAIFCFCIPLVIHLIRFLFFNRKIFHWVKQKDRRALLVRQQNVLQHVFANNNAFEVSMKERRRLQLDPAYTYGEITFPTFVYLLDVAKPLSGEIFYDLGCGIGKAVSIAALCYPFQKVVGVEYIAGLYELADRRIRRLKQYGNLLMDKLHVQHGDFRELDFLDADVIFANATCFEGELWSVLLDRFSKLKIGARIILTTRILPEPMYQCLYGGLLEMSWGMNAARVYIKKQ